MAGGPACELFSRLSSSWNVELSTVCHKMSRIFLWTDFSLGHQISTNIYIYIPSLYIQNTYIVEFICICMYFLFILKSKFPTTVATSKPRRKLTPSKWIWWSHQKLEKIWWVGWGWCLVFWEMVRENANNAGNPPKKGWKADTAKQQRNQQMIFWPQEHLLPDQRGQFRHRFGWQAVDPFGLEPHLTLIRFLKTRCSVLRRYKMFTWIFL